MNSLNKKPRRILVVNSKGGCGKTTIATNLAGYIASINSTPVLFDYDPQGSSMQWLSMRPLEQAEIVGISAYKRTTSSVTRSWQMRLPPEAEYVIMDAPAGVYSGALLELVRDIDTLIIPVLPSAIDIHACSHFIEELLLYAKVRRHGVRVGVVANRVRKNTIIFQSLKRFLASLDIDFITTLRDSQNYVKAFEAGLSIHENLDRIHEKEHKQWEPLIKWLDL